MPCSPHPADPLFGTQLRRIKDYLLHPQEDGAVRYYQIVKAADLFIRNTQRENIFGKTITPPMYWAATVF